MELLAKIFPIGSRAVDVSEVSKVDTPNIEVGWETKTKGRKAIGGMGMVKKGVAMVLFNPIESLKFDENLQSM